MARFSAREGRWIPSRKRHSSLPMANPYAPTSPAYAERHRETVTDIGNGMVRVDVGKRIPHGPPEA